MLSSYIRIDIGREARDVKSDNIFTINSTDGVGIGVRGALVRKCRFSLYMKSHSMTNYHFIIVHDLYKYINAYILIYSIFTTPKYRQSE